MNIAPEGDSCLIIRLAEGPIDSAISAHVIELAKQLNRAKSALPGIIEAIPSFQTIGVYYDLDILGASAYERVVNWIQQSLEERSASSLNPAKTIRIPVCYAPEYALDMPRLMEQTGLSTTQIIELHCQQPVRVFMLGFSPGLPYLGLFDARFNLPRLANPRTHLAPGSVGIANRQCVIYPYQTPGGWNIIGRTPLCLFDATTPPYTLYQPGDFIQFEPISPTQFLEMSRA